MCDKDEDIDASDDDEDIDMTRPRRKVNKAIVRQMRTRFELGETQAALAREFGISVIQVGRITRGECWGEVQRDPTQQELDEMHARIMANIAAGPGMTPREVAEPHPMDFTLPKFDMPMSPELREKAIALGLKVPPSPMDGGDAPDEPDREGAGLNKLFSTKVEGSDNGE